LIIIIKENNWEKNNNRYYGKIGIDEEPKFVFCNKLLFLLS
jgi:hypothetical protein